MRRIVQCNACERKYDATTLEAGSRFHCHCGAVVQVTGASGHNSNVSHCSSCGASRNNSDSACPACSAPAVEQENLTTVCPACSTQVSDVAQFCHHCGVTLSAESAAGEVSSIQCPHCNDDHAMVNRSVGKSGVPIVECDHCAGIWLSNEVFQGLVSKTQETAPTPDPKKSVPRTEVVSDPDWKYRKCPVCQEMMARRNYGRRSGVIVDSCVQHGIWFDADELTQILAWVKKGGLKESERLQVEEETREDERAERRERDKRRSDGLYDDHFDSGVGDVMLGVALFSLFDL